MKKIVYYIAVVVVLTSCTITKCHFSSGYHVDFWKKEILNPRSSKVFSQGDISKSDRLCELQSATNISSNDFVVSDNNQLQYQTEMNSDVDSLSKKDSDLFFLAVIDLNADTVVSPQASEEYINPKEKVNPKAAIGFGLSVLGILTAFFAPYLVFYLTVIGFLLSYLGYKEIKRHGGRGEKLAKWGMAIPLGAFALVIFFGLIFLLAYGIALA